MLKKKKENMLKMKKLVLSVIFMGVFLILLTTKSNAAVKVERNIYSNNGSMKFNFTGLTLDTTHEYQFGLTKVAAEEVTTWNVITEYTNSKATVDLITTTSDIRKVINAVDTGFITIKDKTTDTVVLPAYSVNLKIPYLRVTNETVINNGKEYGREFGSIQNDTINVALRNNFNSVPYYQYEKITDQNIIKKYKEIKAKNGNIFELESMLTTTVPTTKWSSWDYWNGYNMNGMDGFGYPTQTIQTPDTGLYYLWVYFSGKDIKNMYGYILVDNLEADTNIAVSNISLKATETVELGKTLQLTPTINPTNATNKIVTWTSSDKTVATVDNLGKITPKKVGSTIITVTTQDGNKKATCTITVTKASNNENNNNSNTNNNTNPNTNTNANTNTNTNTTNTNKDTTAAPGVLPQTGIKLTVIFLLGLAMIGSILFALKYNKFKDIK